MGHSCPRTYLHASIQHPQPLIVAAPHLHFPTSVCLYICTAGEAGASSSSPSGIYAWSPSNDPAFFPGRQAAITARGQAVGIFGVVHPDVLAKFDIPFPVSALEIYIEPFCYDQYYDSLLISPY